QAMMDLGGRVCSARSPKCERCPIANWCRARPLFASGRAQKRVSEARASYRAEPPYEGSRRYYRGRIVEALRELPAGRSLTRPELLARIRDQRQDEARPTDGTLPTAGRAQAAAGTAGRGQAAPTAGRASARRDGLALDLETLAELIAALRSDGLVRISADGRVRLP
ncbi:MAG: hypothetical protein WD939_09535, partial [Dehalococcoidia bacterium]